MTRSAAIGIDLGGTRVKVALVAQAGRIIVSDSFSFNASAAPSGVVGQMAALSATLLQRASLSEGEVIGVGVGAPGPLSVLEGRIHHCANLPMWINVPLRDLLSAQLNKPVVLENDGNAAAFGEYWAGAGREGGDLVMLTLGTGVGGGVVIGGRLLHGDFENAAELGHMIVVPDGLPCACGQRGCLEAYASATAVAHRVSEELARASPGGPPPPHKSITAEQVVEAARRGDALCDRVWNEACRYLAVACVNIQHLYNPRRVVLGGGMAQAGAFLGDRVRQFARNMTWKLHDDFPEIVLAQLGYDAGVIGAAGLVWNRSP